MENKLIQHSFWEFFKWMWEINMFKTSNEYNTKKEFYLIKWRTDLIWENKKIEQSD